MQQTDVPEIAIPFAIFSMCILGLLALSARLWFQGLMRWSSGQSILPKPEHRLLQPWGFVDLVFAFVMVLGLQMLSAYGGVLLHIGPRPSPDGELGLLLLTWISTIQTMAVLIVTMFIALRCGVKASSIGWSLARLPNDISLGIKAFIVLAPPVYLLMIVVTQWSGKDYKHPIHALASEDPWMLIPAIFMAVILAPLGEEFAFRVLLQGFLESLSVGRFSIEKFFLGRYFDSEIDRVDSINMIDTTPELIAIENQVTDDANPYAFEVSTKKASFGDASLPWWPIFVSGLLFGLAHIEYGMSWIPLTILGIAMGWLYRITNRIWPSLVVHFCVNATSMIGFSLTVLYGDPTKAIP